MAKYIDAEKIDFSMLKNDFDRARAKVMVMATPTADVAEVRHGEWIEVDDGVLIGDGKHLECSECHIWKKDKQKSNYCPHCGAKMDGGGRE